MWKHLRYGIVFAVLIMATVDAQGQQGVLRLTPYNGQASSFINEQIKADTTTNHGIPAGRIYELQRGGTYLATAIFNVTTGKTLSLRANDSTGRRPIIMLYPTGSGTTPARPPGNLFQLGGGNLVMKNIMVTGYFEPIDTNFNNIQGGIINTNATGSSIIIDSCLFTQIAGQHIRTGNATVKVQVTNTVFADMGALSTSNLGAGKGFDLREASCDSLILVNNTFVNFQDRVVRHYNFANPGAGTAGIKYFLFDHNTIVNGMSYHGLLSLGNLGGNAIITNNLFLDAFACGEDSGDASRQAEWANTGEKYPNGSNRMPWIFTAPDQTTQWMISNNYYAISDSGQAFLNQYAPPAADVLGAGSPLSWHINSKLGADSISAFKKLSSLRLGNIPALMTKLMRWYRDPDGGKLTKNTPSSLWVRSRDDMDRRKYQYYDDTLDCSYATSSQAYNAGANGYPVGDLNWFPAKKAAWLAIPPSGGPGPASVKWNLIMPDSANPSTIVGNVTGQPISGSNFYVRSFSGTPNGPLGTTNMRWWPSNDGGVTGASWGPETGEVANRWIQLSAAPKAGFAFVVDSVSLWSCGGGTSTMRFNVYYSTDASFATKTRLNADTVKLDNSGSVTATTRYAYKVGATVPSGKAFYFRIYPWYEGAASTSKYVYTQLAEIKGSTTTATAVRDEELMPREMQLAQNYPNPFNPSTTFQFSITKSSHVLLEVFNILGQPVARLVDENLSAGTYRMNFDASALSSGVYLYRLTAGNFTQTMKMVLMK